MFEAVALICMELSVRVCRDQLLPGYEAATKAGCDAALLRAPVAGAARCRPVGPALPVVEVADGVFVHMGRVEEPDAQNLGDVSNFGFVIGGASVAVIDTGSARWLGEGLWRSIRAVTDKPVSHVILTHMHPDHVFGAGPFVEAGAEVVAHARLPRDLADRAANYLESFERLIGPEGFAGSAPVPVSTTVSGRLTLDLGERPLAIQAWPAAHSVNDLTVYDPRTGTFFAGDLVFERHIPALDGALTGWRQVLAELRALDVARVVPGHGAHALDWPDGSDALSRYLEVLEADTRAAVEAGIRLGEAVRFIAASEAPHWALFEDFNARNATVAYTELEWE